MGKLFRIVSINHAAEFSHAFVVDENNAEDHRYLHLERFLEHQAKGLETDSNWSVIPDAPGYILLGNSNLGKWKKGDLVTEQVYPEEFDNR